MGRARLTKKIGGGNRPNIYFSVKHIDNCVILIIIKVSDKCNSIAKGVSIYDNQNWY
ncbi:hypothetical protein BCE02nite_57080 [Brevibacillus centrosporus]|nr:hypothetical protein BCE02nite_57080 [Brevibacillus centrosporus]